MSIAIRGELVLLVIDRGLTKSNGLIPVRTLMLIEQTDAGREGLMSSHDVSAGFAAAIADALLAKGIAVEDVYDPLPGLERPGTTPADKRGRRKKKEATP